MCSGPRLAQSGARLINPNGTIEHAGLVLGVNGTIAQSAFHGFPAEHPGVNRQLQMTRNYSAISGACLLMRREVFQEIGGFDEMLRRRFADIDLCLKMRRAGYLIVYTPLAKLYWDASSGGDIDTSSEVVMRQRWSDVLERGSLLQSESFAGACATFSLGECNGYSRGSQRFWQKFRRAAVARLLKACRSKQQLQASDLTCQFRSYTSTRPTPVVSFTPRTIAV